MAPAKKDTLRRNRTRREKERWEREKRGKKGVDSKGVTWYSNGALKKPGARMPEKSQRIEQKEIDKRAWIWYSNKCHFEESGGNCTL